MTHPASQRADRKGLYTPEERRKRDATIWTTVQGVLAPIQFIVCIISAILVIHTLTTQTGYTLATASILLKTALLYTIMITGAIWEKVVFGQYLFAPAFFWEDVVSFAVIALHTAYLIGLWWGYLSDQSLMMLALVAYAVYIINAVQFVLKLRAARLDAALSTGGAHLA